MIPKISTFVSKLGSSIPTINLPPVLTCRENAPCFKGCYALRGNFMFHSSQTSALNNLQAYVENPEKYFVTIDYNLRLVPYRFFRYHSSGDIVDERYLLGMCNIARKHMNTKFLCFTKKDYLINNFIKAGKKIPKNLIIVLSAWGSSFIPENPYNLPVAYVKLKGEESNIPKDAKSCSGKCSTCCETEDSCWKLEKGQSLYFNKH